jgi:hypothetical protein
LATTWPAGLRRPLRSAERPLALALLFASLAIQGCDASGARGDGGKKTVDSNGGHYTVDLQTSPRQVVVNQPFDVSVTVTPKGAASGALDVLVDARMPAHFHGMNRVPKLTRGAGNTWKAEGMLFHMSGHWELYVDITQGGTTERAQLDVDLK